MPTRRHPPLLCLSTYLGTLHNQENTSFMLLNVPFLVPVEGIVNAFYKVRGPE